MHILVTGGAGYIGSHTVVELLAQSHQPVIVDNFSNSGREVLNRLRDITGQDIPFYEGDVCDKAFLEHIFDEQPIEAAIHFASLKAVGESIQKPLEYYRNNLVSALTLCQVMQERGVKKLIFSSSAAIYGPPEKLPIGEDNRTGQGITNPYGHTKVMIEQILRDLAHADPEWAITMLRYFNPIGAHASGKIGEDPNGIPSNLMPYVAQVAVGRRERLSIFGGDYPTRDGTGERDYIHVVDLARGHLAALEHLQPSDAPTVYNLGTGHGVTVLELVQAFKKASGKEIPYEIVARRPGDLASVYADASKAERELGWKAEKTIDDGCADSWRWQSQNPSGFSQS